ncbi:MAG: PGF-CTERM sorting domain-containing protein [Methanophagales archaeon]|nr:PGF-CTERM sorting domain-containing protein [Methanophagales archaeon]
MVGMLLVGAVGTVGAAYSDTVNDGTGDVMHWHFSKNAWGWSYNNERPNIDITQIKMSDSGGIITLTMKVKGTIIDSERMITYMFFIVDDKGTATIDDDSTYVINYVNGESVLMGGDEEEYYMLDLSENASHSGDTLTTHFSLSAIGNPGQLKFSEDSAGFTTDHPEAGEEGIGEYYSDVVPDEDVVTPDEEKEEKYSVPGEKGKTPGFEAVFAVAGLLAVAYLLRRR